jgi:hypothetical protein
MNIDQTAEALVKSTHNLLGLAAALLATVVLSYVMKFGGPWGELPLPIANAQAEQPVEASTLPKRAPVVLTLEERRATQAVWGQLGDYMGGVLNPLLSFLALYLLVRTLQLQQLQIKQSQDGIQSANASNEIAALGAALDAIREDVSQLQASKLTTPEQYDEAYKLKVWLATEIVKRAKAVAAMKT